jgi:hypothetical protein
MERPMQKLNDLSRSLTLFEPDGTLIAVVEMSLMSWLVAGIMPGVERQPLKKLGIDQGALLTLLYRWREEAERAGHRIKRIAVAFEAGRDGFWLARWLRVRDIEVHVIHASSVAVPREHRRAKTDRLDTRLLKRAFLGWLRVERDHCKMAAIPTLSEEDARRPNRERENLVGEQSRIVNRMKATLTGLQRSELSIFSISRSRGHGRVSKTVHRSGSIEESESATAFAVRTKTGRGLEWTYSAGAGACGVGDEGGFVLRRLPLASHQAGAEARPVSACSQAVKTVSTGRFRLRTGRACETSLI